MIDLITITWKCGLLLPSQPLNIEIVDCLAEMAITEAHLRFVGQTVGDKLVLYRVDMEINGEWHECTEKYVAGLYYQAFCPECIELKLDSNLIF